MQTFEQILKNWSRYIEIRANSFAKPYPVVQDLENAGREGLWIALNKWDQIRDFPPYAISYINGYMLKYLQQNDNTIYLPAQQYWNQLHNYNVISINQSVDFDENLTIEDILPSEPIYTSFEDKDAKNHLKMRLEGLFKQIKNKKHIEWVKLRYGIDCEKEYTIIEISELPGTDATRQAIDLAIRKVLKQLKENVRKKDIE